MEYNVSLQTLEELEKFYKTKDPWGYEKNLADRNRKSILLGELGKLKKPKNTLDIGCGHGFITRDLPGEKIIGVDLSKRAIQQAKKMSSRQGCTYVTSSIFDLSREKLKISAGFDLIVVTGVLYPQYIGLAKTVVYEVIDKLLISGGTLVSVHIGEWYTARLPYTIVKDLTYKYREYQHYLEIYKKL